jgi:CBS domain containing-hemolysin-like protein
MTFLNVLFIFFLVALNSFFVVVEFAVIASRRTRIEKLVQDGNRAAKIVKRWIENPSSRDRLVAAAQLGITIVSLALGSVGEHTFEVILEPFFQPETLPPFLQFLETIFPALPLVLSLIITTSLHVVFGEQVPKVAVLNRPEKFALFAARPMNVFNRIFKGSVDLLDWATQNY